MRRFVLLGGLIWVGGAALALLAAALLFYAYHATGLADIVTAILVP